VTNRLACQVGDESEPRIDSVINFSASEVETFVQDIGSFSQLHPDIEAQHVSSSIVQKNQRIPRSFLVIGKRDALLLKFYKQVFFIPIR